MRFDDFYRRAEEIFEEIPSEFRGGLDGLQVVHDALPHPEHADVYTMGECRTEGYPSAFGDPDTIRSLVVLYYGSFLRLSELDSHFDWEEELFETITHEVRHHLESLAAEDELEEVDYANEQNFARREGKPFDPFFYRLGVPAGEGEYEVGHDIFLQWEMTPEEFQSLEILEVEWEGGELRVPRPERLGDVHFVSLGGFDEGPGELYLVLLRRRGALESLRQALSGGGAEVLHSEVDPL